MTRAAFIEPEETPRPLIAVPIPGGFMIRGKTLYASLKHTRKAVKFAGIVVDPYILRQIARLYPLLEVRPRTDRVEFRSPNGRHRMTILHGAGAQHKGALGYWAEIRPVVQLAAAAD